MNVLTAGFIAAYVLSAALTITAQEKRLKKAFMLSKPLTAALYMSVSYICYRTTGSDVYIKLIPEFFCCFAGDVFLMLANEIYDDIREVPYLLGILFLGTAHVCLIINLSSFAGPEVNITGNVNLLGLIFGTVLLIANALSPLLGFRMGHKTIVNSAYGFLVGYLGGLGLSAVIFGSAPFVTVIGIGAFLFMIADSAMVFKFFSHFSPRVKTLFGILELSLYYAAMLLFSICVLFV